MGSYVQSLILIMMGMLLLWFGYSLFANIARQGSFSGGKKRKKQMAESVPGAPRTCPVCSARLEQG
jgi:uncharacterized membrane protein